MLQLMWIAEVIAPEQGPVLNTVSTYSTRLNASSKSYFVVVVVVVVVLVVVVGVRPRLKRSKIDKN